MEVSDQHHSPAALRPRKEPRQPLSRQLVGPQSRSALYWQKKCFALRGVGQSVAWSLFLWTTVIKYFCNLFELQKSEVVIIFPSA